MRVLITGGAGFIGSYLIKFWLKADPGLFIVNLDKLTYCGDLSRLAELKSHPRYEFLHGDICDPAKVKKALSGCDAIVHLAAETHVDRSLLEAKAFFDANLYGTYVLLEAARQTRLRKFLFVSTDEVYGSRPRGFFTEKDVLHPTSPYSISKAAADLMVSAYSHVHGMHTLITRGSNTYGPYQYPEKVVPLFVSHALSNQKLPLYGDGLQVRNWLHVEDHCRGIITVFNKGRRGETYNISSSQYLTNRELTQRILKTLNKPTSLIQKVKDRVGHDRRYAIDCKKLRGLGWKERFSFERAFEETVRWYRKHEDWWKAIKEKNTDFKRYYQKAYHDKV